MGMPLADRSLDTPCGSWYSEAKEGNLTFSMETISVDALRWLHLSDLHRGMDSQKWLWPNIEGQLFDDLSRLRSTYGPWHLVFFTGDLVQKGRPEESTKLNETLGRLYAHLRTLDSNPLLITVPGNHDLARPLLSRPEMLLLQEYATRPEMRKTFWEDAACPYRRTVTEAFAGYTEWCATHPFPRPNEMTPGMLPGDVATTVHEAGIRLGVVGLNTAFLQLTDGVYDGRLDVHPAQLAAVCGENFTDWFADHDVCILMTHHPPSWLSKDGQNH